MHIIIPARNERWRSWACAVCVCVYFALHCRVLRDPVTVSQLATTPLNINKPCFVYFVHWKGENIFASFFSHFISIFVDCSNMISAYQRQSCSLVAAMETGQQRERAWNQHTQSSMPPFSFASNCTGANQTGDSSDFIFPSPALVQLFRLIASSLLYFFFKVLLTFFDVNQPKKRKQKKILPTSQWQQDFVASFDTMWRDWRLLLMRAWPRAPTGCWPSFRLPSLSLFIRFVSLLLLSLCVAQTFLFFSIGECSYPFSGASSGSYRPLFDL